jgi:hypothetical protein
MTTDKAPGLPVPLRRLLRMLNGVELWHVEDDRKGRQRIPTIRYAVKSTGNESIFERPHEAWRYFQQLTQVPDRDVRPEPPPIESSLLTPRAGKRQRLRRKPS